MSATDEWWVIRVDADTAEAAKEYAEQVGLPLTEIVRNALQREFLPGVRDAVEGGG